MDLFNQTFVNILEIFQTIDTNFIIPAGVSLSAVALLGSYFLLFKNPKTKYEGNVDQRSFSKDKIKNKKFDSIVIGSGIGGMTTASLIAQTGKRVLVLEQHDRLGGCTHSFKRLHKSKLTDKFVSCEFDTGTHYTCISMAHKYSRIGSILNSVVRGKLEWLDIGDPWDNLYVGRSDFDSDIMPDFGSDTKTFQFHKGKENIVRNLVNSLLPLEVTSKFTKTEIEEAQRALGDRISKFLDFCGQTTSTIIPFFIGRMLPDWFERMFLSYYSEKFYRASSLTTGYVLSAIFDHDFTFDEVLAKKELPKSVNESDPLFKFVGTRGRAKGVLIHPLGDYACQPKTSSIQAHALTMKYYIDGAAYTNGPTQLISRYAGEVVLENGGDCLVNARVEKILMKNKTAIGVTNELIDIFSTNIINAAGVYNLYNQFLPKELPVVKNWNATFKSKPSTGHIFMFVALEGTPDELNIPKTNLWFFNGFDTDKCFDEYFESKGLTNPPTVYLGFPCRKDPTWNSRFPGVSNCILISDGDYSWFEKWAEQKSGHRDKDYEELKEKLGDTLLEILYDKIPETRGKVSWYEVGTPLTDSHYLGSYEGGSYGTKCTPSYFSEDSKKWVMTGKVPEVRNLYQSGEDAFCPSVAGACYGGLLSVAKTQGVVKTFGLGVKLLLSASSELRKEQKIGFISSIIQTFKNFMK